MRRVAIFLIGVLVAVFICVAPALANSSLKSVFVIGQKKYTVLDGEVRCMDVAPFIKDGRTYTPLRFIADAVGIAYNNIEWDNTSKTATLTMNSTTTKFTVGSTTYIVNGQTKQMDVAPLLEDGRVFLPARYVAGIFGYSVSWDDKSQAVILTSTANTVDDSKYSPQEIEEASMYDYLVKLNKVHPVDDSLVYEFTVTEVKENELTGTIEQIAQDKTLIKKSLTIKKQPDTILVVGGFDLTAYNLSLTDVFRKGDFITAYCDRNNRALLLQLNYSLLDFGGKVKVIDVGQKTLKAQVIIVNSIDRYANRLLRTDLVEKIAKVNYFPGVILNLTFDDTVTAYNEQKEVSTNSSLLTNTSDLTTILKPGDRVWITESFGKLKSVSIIPWW